MLEAIFAWRSGVARMVPCSYFINPELGRKALECIQSSSASARVQLAQIYWAFTLVPEAAFLALVCGEISELLKH